MAHAQLLNSINDPSNLNRKQPLHIELNGRQLTLDEYNRLIRLSKHRQESQQQSSLSQQQTYSTTATTTTTTATTFPSTTKTTTTPQQSPPHESSNEDANGVGGRGRTINTITIKTVCTSAKPIRNTNESSPSMTTTSVTTTVPGAVTVFADDNGYDDDGVRGDGHSAGVMIGAAGDGAIGDQFNQNQQFQRESSVRSQSSTQPLSKPHLSSVSTAALSLKNSQILPNHHSSHNGRIPSHSASAQSSPNARSKSRTKDNFLSKILPTTSSSPPSGTSFENVSASKHSVEVTHETLRETTHRIPVDQLTNEQMHSAGLLQYQTQPFRVSTAVTTNNNSQTNYGSLTKSASTTMSGGGGRDNTLGSRSRQNLAGRHEPGLLNGGVSSPYFEPTHLDENLEQSLVSSGHVQQQINQLSARMQTQPQLQKSYQRLVHQQHSLLTSSSGTGNDQQSREVVTQQLRYTDDWNRPPVKERHLERTVERQLLNGSVDRQVSRQMERNLLTSPSSSSNNQQLASPNHQTLPHRFASSSESGRTRQRLRSRDELDSDQFVQELRTRIANGSQSTSSPNVASARSATLDRKWTSSSKSACPADSGGVENLRDFSSSTSQFKLGDRSRSADRRRPDSTVVMTSATSASGTLSKSSNVIGSPGGSLAAPIRTSQSHEVQQVPDDEDPRLKLRPEDYAHLSSQLPSARFSYACSRNVNGYPEGGGGGDESGSDQSPQERINHTADSSRFSDETLDVSKRSIEFDPDSSNSFRKRDKYGFFVDQESQTESSQRK